MDDLRIYQNDPEYIALIEAALKLEDVERYLTGELLEDAQQLRHHLTVRIGSVVRRLQRQLAKSED